MPRMDNTLGLSDCTSVISLVGCGTLKETWPRADSLKYVSLSSRSIQDYHSSFMLVKMNPDSVISNIRAAESRQKSISARYLLYISFSEGLLCLHLANVPHVPKPLLSLLFHCSTLRSCLPLYRDKEIRLLIIGRASLTRFMSY